MKNIVLYISFLLLTMAGCRKPDMSVTLAPGTVAVSTTANYLKNNFDFSLFAAALAKSGMEDSLNNKDVLYTVFAVSNNGFRTINILSASQLDKWGQDSLKHFIKTHLLPGRINYQDFPNSLDTKYKNINGDDLFISRFQNSIAVNGVKIKANMSLNGGSGSYGISLLNGLVYPVDAPVKASSVNIQQFLTDRGDMNIFITALKKYGLWDEMKAVAPITVLAVPDSVFLRYGITADSINAIDTNIYKKVLIDCYIVRTNRVFQSDLYSFVNLANAPLIPATFPPEFIVSTSDPNLALCMRGYYFDMYPFGCFVFDISKQVSMKDEYGSTFWFYQILGPNATNYPVDNEPASGYQVPYIGESKKAGSLNGTYLNYSLSNGAIHLLADLLLTPDDVKK